MAVYTVFSQTGGGIAASDSSIYTLTMMFTVSQSVALTGIWFNSPSATGATLPTGCCIFVNTGGDTGTIVPGTSVVPAWSGAAGSGWVKNTYDGSVTLTSGNFYSVAVFLNGATNQQYGATAHYWDTGAGAGGLTNGPLSALSNSAAATVLGTAGQDAFVSPGSGLTYPTTSFNATNYWVDVEVTTSGTSGPPVYPLRKPVAAVVRVVPPRGGQQLHTPAYVAPLVPVKGPPVYPLGHPVHAKIRTLTVRGQMRNIVLPAAPPSPLQQVPRFWAGAPMLAFSAGKCETSWSAGAPQLAWATGPPQVAGGSGVF